MSFSVSLTMEILRFYISEMYEEFLESKLSDMLIGESDFLSDFVTPEVEMAGPGEDRNYGTNQKAEKARAQCETQLNRLWIKPELEFCGKLGSYFNSHHTSWRFYAKEAKNQSRKSPQESL